MKKDFGQMLCEAAPGGQLFLAESRELDKPDILLYSHELLLGGAPVALCELGKVLMQKYHIYVLSPQDGMNRQEFVNAGMDVFVCAEYNARMRDLIVRNMRFVVVNTMIPIKFIYTFFGFDIPICWWIHENINFYEGIEGLKEYYEAAAARTLLYSVGIRAGNNFYQAFGIRPAVLNLGVRDVYLPQKDRDRHEKIRIFCSSGINYLKGQDILAGAIQLLPEEYRNRCEFYFVGEESERNRTIYRELKRLESMMENIKVFPLMSKEEIFELYYQMDVVIAPSRDDSMPFIIVEGMMYRKICMCSDGTGVSKYMRAGVDGFVFRKEDMIDTRDKLQDMIERFSELDGMREAARSLYETMFCQEVFERNVWEIVEKMDAV